MWEEKMMTVDKILACEIPEGPYKLAMEQFKNLIITWDMSDRAYTNVGRVPGMTDSLCAAFSALYELAKGKKHESFGEEMSYAFGRDEGRADERKRVLDIVEEMENNSWKDGLWNAYVYHTPGVRVDVAAWRELRRRIETEGK